MLGKLFRVDVAHAVFLSALLKHVDNAAAAGFFFAVGVTANDAEELRDTLLQAVKTHEAQLGPRDAYGQRYIVDFFLTWHGKQPMIRSEWIIEHGTDTPRLTTYYPL